ncbi:MAG: phage portal protein family protein [Chroococcidiopsis sp.]
MADKVSLIEYAGIGGGKDITRGFVNAFYKWLPTQDSLLNLKSGGDLELYEQVAQDDQVKSCLQQRFRALIAKDWEVIPGGEKRVDKQAAEHIEKQLGNINWDDRNEKMLWGIHYGYSAAEILWKREDDKVEISAIKVRNRRRFHFNDEQRLVLKTMQNPLGEDLPERKFWHFCTGADHDDEPYGRGLGYWLYWPTFFKRNGVRWWLKFVEKYAQPTRLGKYPAGATQGEKDTLWNALGSFGDDARSMIPEGLEMEFLESSRAGTVDYKALCDQMDAAIAKIILSQTMTTDNGSSLSQAEVHEGVKDEVIESDADLLCESFNNGPAKWLTDWNFPGAAYPKVRRKIQVDPDPAAMADTDTKLQGLGISLKPEAIVAKYGEDYIVPENSDSVPHSTGEQVNALVSIITNAKQGGWSDKLVAGIINGAFPNWPDEAVAAITSNLGDGTGDGTVPVPTDPQSLDEIETEFAMSDLEVEFKIAEGTVKEKNGVKYVLTNSRWRRAEPKTKEKPKTKGKYGKYEPGFVGDIPIDQISADPKRFQYKLLGAHTKTGEVGSLSGVQNYDPNLAGIVQTWKDPADGKLYIINGHNRLALAQRAGVDKVTTRIIDAPDAATARGIGALTNIAEGRGTALDAAKFFRDSGLTADDIKKKGIPLREKIATDGLGIAALEPQLFNKVVEGELSESRAALLGKTGLTGAQQVDLYKLSETKTKKGKLTDDAFQELVDSVKASQSSQATLFDLFGASTVEKSNALERASLTASIKQQMSRDKKLFGLVSKTKVAKDLARAGNQIDTESSGKIADSASQLLGVFDQLKNQSGGVSSVLNSYASQVSDGKITPAKAKTEAYKEIAELIKSGKL